MVPDRRDAGTRQALVGYGDGRDVTPRRPSRAGNRSGCGCAIVVSAALLAVLVSKIDPEDLLPERPPPLDARLPRAGLVITALGIVLSAWRWQRVLAVFDARAAAHAHGALLRRPVRRQRPAVDRSAATSLRISRSSATTSGRAAGVRRRRARAAHAGSSRSRCSCFLGFLDRPVAARRRPAWVALAIALGTARAPRRHPASSPAIPRLAGRFAEHENWMRFIGAVHVGVDRLRADQPRDAFGVLGAALVYQVSVVAGRVLRGPRARRPDPRRRGRSRSSPRSRWRRSMPISVGGLGVREGMLVLLLHPLGVPTAQAVAHRAALVRDDARREPARRARLRGRQPRTLERRARSRHRRTAVSILDRPARPRPPPAPGRPRPPRRPRHLLVGSRSLAIVAFYVVYSAVRNPTRADRRGVHARHGDHRLAGVPRHQPRGDAPATGRCTSSRSSSRPTTSTGRCTSSSRPASASTCSGSGPTTTRAGATRSPSPPGSRSSGSCSGRSCRRACSRASYGFVDTLAKYPTFWSFNSGAVNKISNQFAAMPSVHCAWALWCACALVPRLQAHAGRRCLAAPLPGRSR